MNNASFDRDIIPSGSYGCACVSIMDFVGIAEHNSFTCFLRINAAWLELLVVIFWLELVAMKFSMYWRKNLHLV